MRRSPTRRPGRVRRWLVRPLFWGLAALAVAVLAAVLLLRSRWTEERAAAALVAYLEARLETPVRLESLSLELLPLGAELRGLELGAGDAGPPFATLPRVSVQADFRTFWRPSIHLRRLVVERPTVRLSFLEDGADNLIRWRSPRPGVAPPPVAVEIGVVELVGGWLEIDDRRLPLEAEVRAVQARLVGAGQGVLEGRVSADGASVRLQRGRPELEALSFGARLRGGLLEFFDGRALAPDLSAAFSGAYRWGETRELTLDVTAQGAAQVANRWDLLETPIAGPARLAGGFAWRPTVWGFRGTLEADALDFLERRFAEVVTVVAVDRHGYRLDVQQAAHGDGRLSGAVTIGPAEAGRPTKVDLELSEVRLSRLLADLAIPVRGVEGRVSGPLSYRFAGEEARRGDGWAGLRVTPEAEAAPGVIHFGGSIPLTIERGRVGTEAMRLRSAAHGVVAAGSFDLVRRRGRFDYEIDTEELPELIARLPLAATPEPPPWLPVAGRGRLDGSLLLEAGAAASEVALDLDAVRAAGYSAERLRGSLAVDPDGFERLRLELERPGAALLVSGAVPFSGDEPFSLTFDAAGWPLSDLAYWLPAGWPQAGRVGGRLVLGGRPEALAAEIQLRCGPLELGGLEAGELGLDANYGGGRWMVREAELATPAGTVRLGGWIDAEQDRVELELDSDLLDLSAPPFALFTGDRLSGSARLGGRLIGPLSAPRLRGRLDASELAVDGRPLGEAATAVAELSWDGTRLEATGSLAGLAAVEGGGRLDRTGLDVELELRSDELGAWVEWLAPGRFPELSGSLGGRLRLEAATDAPELAAARLVLDRLEARWGGRELAALEPVTVELSRAGVRLESLWLGQPGSESELFVSGTLRAGEETALDLSFQSTLESDWFAPLVRGVRLRGGRLQAIASIRGTAAVPEVNGVAELSGVAALVPGLPSSLEGVSAVALLDPGAVVIDRASAEFAGGRLRASGTVSAAASGWEVPDYRLQIVAEDVNVRYPEGWLLRGDGVASLLSTPEGRSLSGRIDLDRALYRERVDLGLSTLLKALFARRRLEVGPTDELLATTELNLEVRAPHALQVRNNLADLEGSADLSLRGSLARPVVFGRVELEPGGELTYGGSEYEIERGLLTFANPYRIEPVVDLAARTDLKEYDVLLTVTGTPERLQVSFASDPPLADLEVLTLLGGGPVGGQDLLGEPGGGAGAERFLYGEAASLVTERANLLFGLDKLRVDPLTGKSGSLSSARVTVGKRLSRDLVATYSYDPTTTEEQILELQWSVSRSLLLVLSQNGDGSYSVDALWEKVF